MPGSAVAKGVLESYVRAAALELESQRFKIVVPVFVKESMEMMGMDTSHGMSAADTAEAHVAAAESAMRGQTLNVADYV
jgi:hypothetical protein